MMLRRSLLGLGLVLGLHACAPTPLPPRPDASDARVDTAMSDTVAPPDRVAPPDVQRPDVIAPPDVIEAPDAMDASTLDVLSDDVVVAMDAMDVSDVTADLSDTAVRDSATETGTMGCALPLRPALTVPMAGASTLVTATLPAGGTASSIARHGCTTLGAGSDHIYPLEITSRITLQFVTTSPTTTNTMMSIRRACALETSELACDLDSGPGNGAAFRVTLDPGSYFVVVDDYASSALSARGGDYTLTVSAPVESPAALCTSPTPWMSGTVASGSTNSGGTSNRSCNPTIATGPEVFYRYTLAANTRSLITATPLGMPAWRGYLRVRNDCVLTTCMSVGASPSDGNPASVTVENRSNSPQDFLLSMGSYELGTGGAFTLSDALTMLPMVPPNAVCTTPTLLGPSEDLTMQTTVGAYETRSSSSCAVLTTGGPLTYYSMSVPAGRTMTVTVRPEATFDATVRLFEGCSPTSCLLYNNRGSAGVEERLSYRNTTAIDKTVIIAIGSISAGATGRFDLSTRLLPAMPSNISCALPRSITPASPALAQDQAAATSANSLACEPAATGNVLYYTVSIPAGQTAIVSATPYGIADPVLRVADDCATMTCLASSNSGFGGVSEQLFVSNSGASPRDVIVSLGSRASTSAGVMDVDVRFVTVPGNATCASARTLAPGETVTMQDTSTAIERRTTGCVTTTSGAPLLYYSVNVPAGRSAVLRATPMGMFTATLRVFQTCTPTSCVAYRNSATAGQPEILAFRNTGAADATYTVAVGGSAVNETGTFSLGFELLPAIPSNVDCASARPLVSGTPLLSQNQAAATLSPMGLSCEPLSTGNVLFYSLSVPAGQVATVVATPLGSSYNGVLRVVPACGSAMCLASSNNGFSGSPDTLSLRNSTASDATYVLLLGSSTASTAGIFDLSVTTALDPYIVTQTMSASCDDLSVGSTSAGISGDDSVSGFFAMPFAFSYFGDPVTRFSVSTNGLAQLHTATLGTPTTSYSNTVLPSLSGPTGALAVFWDDLIVSSPMALRYMVTGTAPARRLVMEWNNINPLGSTDTLRFQVKLLESSNTIEYHYCSLTGAVGSTRFTGGSASIAMQDVARTRGLTIANDTAGTVSTGSLIRFLAR
ncbi:MAG: hypothetical protein Q8Q09_28560 [Deltaproteobacteria bacterium]|nr:hypothetical protein [Deltaproteobacteria bacterium]